MSNASGSQGVATTLDQGNVTVYAKLGEVQGSATMSVGPPVRLFLQLTPPVATIRVGQNQNIQVRAVMSNGTTTPVNDGQWMSSAPPSPR